MLINTRESISVSEIALTDKIKEQPEEEVTGLEADIETIQHAK